MPRRRNRKISELAVPAFCRFCRIIHIVLGTAAVWVLRAMGWTLSKFPWSCHFAALFAVMAAVSLYTALYGQECVARAFSLRAAHLAAFEQAGITAVFRQFAILLGVFGAFYGLLSLLAFLRLRAVHYLMKIGASSFFAFWALVLYFVVRVPSVLMVARVDGFSEADRNELWLRGVVVWLPIMLVATLALFYLMLTRVRVFYGGRPASGYSTDKLYADLQSHGRDPRFRTSFYWAAFLHFVVFAGPLIIARGCLLDAYAVPRGQGEQIVRRIKVKRVKRKKKKQLVINLNSPIIYEIPELDDKRSQELDEETMDTYVATRLSGIGKGGKGKGGWPSGMKNAKVRFLRLKYAGGDWDQNMGKGADYNFLIEFQKLTGFKIASETEAIPIHKLRRFKKHQAPPFVFITGKRGIRVSNADVKTLRWYCLEEGGMIFADNGGGNFNASFRGLMRRVFPDKGWVDIANDDVIFQRPYQFPSGAPPLWHHSGDRALGLKHNGRWVVFYHQGDLNDAWQTGHNGVSPYVAEQSYKLGVNVVNYAFNQYMNIHYGD